MPQHPIPTGSREHLVNEHETIFAVDDDDEDEESALPGDTQQHVRFEETVQYIAPPLRSTIQSRETGTKFRAITERTLTPASSEFELDSDSVEEDDRSDEHAHTHGYNDQTMPLLVGLMDAASARRSLDVSLPLSAGGHARAGSLDMEELAAKRIAGGGMLDSVANMANSILGAGESALVSLFCDD
jgi:solute carrier family 38 (sodium-coupled neutral amino acid transporter), member 11